MDDLEQRRQLLDFIYDNVLCLRVCLEEFDEIFGRSRVPTQDRWV
jgi:hypothetical protein